MSEHYQFIVRKGPKVGQTFRLFQDTISIGRDPLSDIVINDPEISRQHAKLVKGQDGYTIEDFGSTNGTFIDGLQLQAHIATDLIPGQLVSMGSGVILLYNILNSETAVVAEPQTEDVNTPAMALPADEPIEIPSLPELSGKAAVSPAMSPQAPLVPSAAPPPNKKRRAIFITAVILLFLLVSCLLSAYYIWGDPLMRALGFYS